MRTDTRERRPRIDAVPTSPPSVAWWGHATTSIDLAGQIVLTDPLLRRGVGPLRWAPGWRAPELRRSPSVVLVSHAHHDHLDLRSLAIVEASAPVVVPRGVGRVLRRHHTGPVVEMSVGEEREFGAVTVRAVHAEHDGRRWGRFGPMTPSLGFVVGGGGRSVYFAGDTDAYPEMALLAEHPLDLAFVPVGGWGLTLGEGHLGPESAAQTLRLLAPRRALPIHWGTLRVPGAWRARPHLQRDPAEAFREAAARLAPDVEVLVTGLGVRVVL